MALGLIDYLKDPQLVASIQQFFGVRIQHNNHFEEFEPSKAWKNKRDGYTGTKDDSNERNHIRTCRDQEINGCDTNSKRLDACLKPTRVLEGQRNEITNKCQEAAATTSNNSHYTITNSFWYYLFLFGTELGDEIFYSAFIPFLFWNIDGAIGRRVVLVWATVMSIGKLD